MFDEWVETLGWVILAAALAWVLPKPGHHEPALDYMTTTTNGE